MKKLNRSLAVAAIGVVIGFRADAQQHNKQSESEKILIKITSLVPCKTKVHNFVRQYYENNMPREKQPISNLAEGGQGNEKAHMIQGQEIGMPVPYTEYTPATPVAQEFHLLARKVRSANGLLAASQKVFQEIESSFHQSMVNLRRQYEYAVKEAQLLESASPSGRWGKLTHSKKRNNFRKCKPCEPLDVITKARRLTGCVKQNGSGDR